MKMRLSRQALAGKMRPINNLTSTNTAYFRVMILFAILQTIALTFFTRGFLLSRNVLPDLATCPNQQSEILSKLGKSSKYISNSSNDSCFHPSPFKKTVILVIDALRFDFTIPNPNTAPYLNNFPIFYDTFTNNSENALLLKFLADPPTTTLQRLKGLSTGSLPTFIDAGSNFDGDTVWEDNLLSQFYHHNKSIAFMGDDTWTAMFSPFINSSICYPYDSLNVWDLHSVDNGVIENIFPLLEEQESWDVLVGHFLGVDHCGHRYGPDHYAMKQKLLQLNDIVEQIMQKISDDTLLIVFGDHGMDSTGNHGGESKDEIEAALFMYSKQPFFKHFDDPDNSIYNISNGGENYRHVNQIDITPTIAMLLGIPIPFNNLGSPIAEAFQGDKTGYSIASMLTSSQINNYRLTSNELRDDELLNEKYQTIWDKWSEEILNENYQKIWEQWSKIKSKSESNSLLIDDNYNYQLSSLQKCKEKWANFDDLNIWIGIILLFISLVVLIIYSKLVPSVVVYQLNNQCLMGSFILILVYCALSTAFSIVFKPQGLTINWALLLGVALGISNGILAPIMDRYSLFWLLLQIRENLVQNGWTYTGMLIIFLHSLIFTSNSFIIWEDKIVSFWLTTFGFLAFFKSFQQNEDHKKYLGAYHSFMFMLFTRLTSLITSCREEQGGKCVSNFKISWWSIVLLYISAIVLPYIIKSFYNVSYSYQGAASLWIGKAFRSVLFLIAIYWTLEYIENDEVITAYLYIPFTKGAKLTIARTAIGISLFVGTIGWTGGPFCVKVDLSETEVLDPNPSKIKKKSQAVKSTEIQKVAKILGYGNVYGSSYFLFFLNILAAVMLVSKPLGGLSLFFLVNQLLTLFELVDILNIRTNLVSVVVMTLLGYLHFFTTGHQATLQSIQWETGFMFTETISFPFTHLAIILNTLGPFILIAVAIPLLVIWKIPPTKKPITLCSKIVENSMTVLIYQTILTLVTLVMTNHLRRHLMVWKIFAPRFMLNALILFLFNIILTFISVGYSSVNAVLRWYQVFGTR